MSFGVSRAYLALKSRASTSLKVTQELNPFFQSFFFFLFLRSLNCPSPGNRRYSEMASLCRYFENSFKTQHHESLDKIKTCIDWKSSRTFCSVYQLIFKKVAIIQFLGIFCQSQNLSSLKLSNHDWHFLAGL